jgi:glycolate oxidase FAD binding subunit
VTVLVPGSLDALQQQVRELHASATPWLPAGLGSRLGWGPPVSPHSTVLSCRALAGIHAHNPGDFTLTVAAGTPLTVIQTALAPHGQWLALDPPWGPAETSIGGVVARGLAGGWRQRHLGVRDQLLGLQLLRSDGVLARAGGQVVKNVAGYDLMRLLTGSWGGLALITELTLRTLPVPPQRRTLMLQAPLEQLEQLRAWLLNSSLSPERIDLCSATLAAMASFEPQTLLVLSLASIDAGTLGEQIACITERAPRMQQLQAEPAAALMACCRGAQTTAAPGWLLRLGVPPARSTTLLAAPELQGVAVCMAAGSGIGDAWASADALPRHRVEALRRRCQELGGYLSVLMQPPGTPGTTPLQAWLDAPSRPLIEALKREFDPLQLLARGRLPGVAG